MRKLPTILLASFVLSAIAYWIAVSVPVSHDVHFSYLVSLSERDTAEEFRFDGFYALQATDLFAATLARWVQTPEVIEASHKQSGVSLQSTDARELSKIIKAEKTAPQLVQVAVKHEDLESAQALTRGLQAVMDGNIDSYHDKGIPAVQFRVVTTNSWNGISSISAPVTAGATFFVVFLLGINLVLLLEVANREL